MNKKMRSGIAVLLAGLTMIYAGGCKDEKAELEKEKLALQQRLEELLADSLKNENAELEKEKLALQQRLEELQQQNTSMNAEKDSLQQQFDELKEQNQAVLDELKGLEDTIYGPPLEEGFYYDSNSVVQHSREMIALKSDRSRFDIDDVTLDFYLGITYINSHDIEDFGDYFYDIYFTDGGYHGPEYLVKSVEEPFYSEDYKCELISEPDHGNFYRYEYKFNKYHTLTIPKEFFCGITGQFYIQLRFTEKAEEPYSKRTFSGMDIYYKIEYGKVAISTNFNDLE